MTGKAERLAAEWSIILDGPVGLAGCGCPNRADGSPPVLHICPRCEFAGGAVVHAACPACAYRAETKPETASAPI